MMYKRLTAALLIAIILPLSACVSLLDATTKGPIQTDPGKRSVGEYWDDKQLCTVVAVNIKKANEALDKAHINVNCFNKVILLTGEVPDKEMRMLAGNTAKEVARVRQVHNELQVRPKTTFLSRSSDNWLAAKIRTKLIAHKDINSDRVKTIVEDDVVYLMGLLTRIQAEKITEVVRTTRGVKKVVRAIEYIDDE